MVTCLLAGYRCERSSVSVMTWSLVHGVTQFGGARDPMLSKNGKKTNNCLFVFSNTF